MNREILYLIALKFLPGIGDATIKKLVAHLGGIEAVWQASKTDIRHIQGISVTTVKTLLDNDLRAEAMDKARAEAEFIRSENIQVTHYLQPEYPPKLFQCPDSPVILYYKGQLKWGNQKFISIVGTRNMTSYGEFFLEQLLADLAPINPVIVSGLAVGVDIKAHRLAIQHKLPTIACVAHGLDKIYPSIHKKYLNDIIAHGAIVTEFTKNTIPDRENFPKRNRIIAGLSDCTLVIESGKKGGSLITADLAFGYNREVFALPGRAGDKYSAGCNLLIKQQKAQLFTSADDILYMMNWEKNGVKKAVQQQLFVELSDDEQKIIDFLRTQPDNSAPIDLISIKTGIPLHLLASLLLNLEFNGILKALPGKRYLAI